MNNKAPWSSIYQQMAYFRDEKIEHVLVMRDEDNTVGLCCVMERYTEAGFRLKAVHLTKEEARALGQTLIDCADGAEGATFGDLAQRIGWATAREAA